MGKCGQVRVLNEPVGIAVACGSMYVSEHPSMLVGVSVFTSEGQFVTSFGRWWKGPGELSPFGLAVDNSGIVVIEITIVFSYFSTPT